MGFIVVIPARFASTRLPGKPLLDIAGKPMIQHVYERALASEADQVYIATDDERIAEAARTFTQNICMTRATHQSGTDRIQEVAQQLRLDEQAVIVNVQGDEPLIPPTAINQVAASLSHYPEAGISSLYEEIQHEAEYLNPNAVKVVTDDEGFALYFSRAPIPWHPPQMREGLFKQDARSDITEVVTAMRPKRHIGIYGYRVGTLNRFVQWPQAALETSERLEQLRAMANGIRIHMTQAPGRMPPGVDTPEDLDAVRALLQAG